MQIPVSAFSSQGFDLAQSAPTHLAIMNIDFCHIRIAATVELLQPTSARGIKRHDRED
jgi:hypothetical protein